MSTDLTQDIILHCNPNGTYSLIITSEQYHILKYALDKYHKQLEASIRYAEKKKPVDHVKAGRPRGKPQLRFVFDDNKQHIEVSNINEGINN